NRQKPSFELTPEARRWHDEHYEPMPELPLFREPIRPGELPAPQIPPMASEEPPGIFLGYTIGNYRDKRPNKDGVYEDVTVLRPGDEVILHTISGPKLVPVYGSAVVADYFRSEMSEYDSSFVFVPRQWLEKLRSMEGRATHLQIKLKRFEDATDVVNAL